MQGQSSTRAYMALAAVCFFWGTTYLGIRMALEMFTPAALVCLRYCLSGSLMVAGCLAARKRLPAGKDLLRTAFFGILILGLGNGCLAFAEQWIPSGLAALFVTVSPFWMLGLEAALPGGPRLHGPTLLGMLAGLAGTLLLVAPGALAHGFSGPVLKAFLTLQLGCFSWSLGSMLQKRRPAAAHPIAGGAVQQLATGLVFIVPALLSHHEPIRWSARGVGALVYLAVFGGVVGYSAYVYALQHLPVAVLSLYNYVNPVVALLLGFLVYKEHLGMLELAGMAIVFVGVALVKRFSAQSPQKGQIPGSQPPALPGREQRHTAV